MRYLDLDIEQLTVLALASPRMELAGVLADAIEDDRDVDIQAELRPDGHHVLLVHVLLGDAIEAAYEMDLGSWDLLGDAAPTVVWLRADAALERVRRLQARVDAGLAAGRT